MSGPGSMNDYNQQVIETFRANGGKVEGRNALLLLTMTGAKSGRSITKPLAYSRDGDRLVVLASKNGAPTNPAWFHNLVANPDVTVEVGGETFPARATIVTDDTEYERLYAQHAQEMPGFAAYREKTTRKIPVIVLERV